MGREKGQRIGPILNEEKETGPGAWCYLARVEKKWTIAELSKKSGVSIRTIKAIEAGNPMAGYNTAYQLRRVLGVGVEK